MTKRPVASLDQLGPRRRDVALLVANGYVDKTIAGRLGMSAVTVRAHVRDLARQINAPADRSARVFIALWVHEQQSPYKDAA